MLGSLQAAVLFALLIAPGFLLVQSYRRGRSYSLPSRDLYVFAQAVVASLAWLAVIWFALQLFDDPLWRWGIFPWRIETFVKHEAAAAGLLLVIVFLPVVIGTVGGRLMNRLQSNTTFQQIQRWAGLGESPTAWEHAWNEARGRASTRPSGRQYIDVSIRMKGGDRGQGRYGALSRADLAPRPSRHVYVETGYGVDDGSPAANLQGDGTIGGVYVDGSEIAAIYFES
ncbi:MAG TPA: DUF6338 family protein [Conexibacter sp.]|nr:DUF6338 family protein [Conexibacter sp.]